MIDLQAIRISCDNLDGFGRAYNAVIVMLPRDVAKRLAEISSNYFAEGGRRCEYALMNNRTIAQIFEEYTPFNVTPVASGEIDGHRYRLYHPKPSDELDPHNRNPQKDVP